ncbi:hypothetical protein [Halopiger djelfimassiliensis]|uniref:hypothetical protein n=1 Tax=Halopiger djelfimassiliensis TaxID=1293047 RepID=UPI00067814B2|nr:hypothetical protein [Halopiger djelfimassiliensis]
MTQCPRRTLLGGIGTTITVALAGNAVAATEDDVASESASVPSEFDSLLDYLPATVASETMMISAVDFERRREANEPHEMNPHTGSFDIDSEAVTKHVSVLDFGDGYSQPITVLSGDIEIDGDAETRKTDDGVEYDFYDSATTDLVAADLDEVIVIGKESGMLEDAVAAGAGENTRLLESESEVAEAFETVDDADSYNITVGDEQLGREIDADADVRYAVHASTVLDPDTMAVQLVFAFEDESDVTDELVESLTGELAYMSSEGEPTVEVDGAVITVTGERDLEKERAIREHESPGMLQTDRDIDPDDDMLELEVGRGDPTPVEDLTLELADEEYDREIWADGHGTIEEGDTIQIDMDDVEPNVSVTLNHDHELGSSSSGTTILNRFEFVYDYDLDAETLTVEYADDFTLDGDRIHLAVYEERPYYRHDEDEPEPRTTRQPWTGETVQSGHQETLEGIRPGDAVIVGWDGASYKDSIGTEFVDPPGLVRFEYDYGSETLSATIEFGEDADVAEQPAEKYELLVEEEPADTQWTDEYETVSDGATIEVTDVPIGTNVSAVWGDDEITVGGTKTRPSIELELDGNEIEHVGGDALLASKLTATAWAEDGRTEVDLGDEIDGDFEEGDTVTFDVDGIRHVTLKYDEEYRVGFAYTES